MLSEKKETSWHFYDVTSWGKFSCFLIGTGKKMDQFCWCQFESELNAGKDFISIWVFGPADSLYMNEKACPRMIVLTGKYLQQEVAAKMN